MKKKLNIIFVLSVFSLFLFFQTGKDKAGEVDESNVVYLDLHEEADILINTNENALDTNNKEKVVDLLNISTNNDSSIENDEVRLSYDPYLISNLTEEDFNRLLIGTGLEGKGRAFVEVEKKYGVNGIFTMAVAMNESAWGKRKANTNNYFGMKGSQGYMSFKTAEDNILYFGELMNRDCYRNKSIDKISKIYCPPLWRTWKNDVKWIMSELFAEYKKK